MDILKKKEDYDRLSYYTSQTKLAKSINCLIEQFNKQICKTIKQIFNIYEKNEKNEINE